MFQVFEGFIRCQNKNMFFYSTEGFLRLSDLSTFIHSDKHLDGA
jgi:hypothetical protein